MRGATRRGRFKPQTLPSCGIGCSVRRRAAGKWHCAWWPSTPTTAGADYQRNDISAALSNASEQVQGRPEKWDVDVPNSLLTGKITGNFAESGHPSQFSCLITARIQ